MAITVTPTAGIIKRINKAAPPIIIVP